MKWMIMVAILSWSSTAYSECRIIEYPDHNEAVCTEDPKPEKPKPKRVIGEGGYYSQEDCEIITNNIYASMKNFIDLQILSPGKVDIIGQKFSNISNDVVKFNRQLDLNLHNNICDINIKYILKSLSDTQVSYARFLISNNKKKEAKQVLRDLIISFVGSNYKSQVKEAEFMLEDLKVTP